MAHTSTIADVAPTTIVRGTLSGLRRPKEVAGSTSDPPAKRKRREMEKKTRSKASILIIIYVGSVRKV
jgi:hypothetical protein